MKDDTRLLEVLRRSHAARLSSDCLDEGTLEALAANSLPAAEAATATSHLGACMSCLAAYAAVRRLLDDDEPEQPWRSRPLWRVRVPLAWAVATAAAAAGLAWVVATTGARGPGMLEPPSTIETSDVRTTQTISGTVRTLERAGTAEVAAHVIEVVVGTRPYTVFVWGEPRVRVGARVSIDGHFLHDGTRHRGVATRITVHAR